MIIKKEFIVKADSGCGSTVGPMINANSTAKTVDIGIS